MWKFLDALELSRCGENGDPTIHVIDDDPTTRDSLGCLLQTDGYEVITYASAQLFVETIRQSDGGCVVTDIHMPGISSLDLLAAMNERGISIPTIVVTGQPTAALAFAAMELGAFSFFGKPFDPDALLTSIRTALSRQAAPSVSPRGSPVNFCGALSRRQEPRLSRGVADNSGCDSKFSLLVRRLQKRPNKGTSDRGEDGAGDRSRKA
jgi:two-component system response regulator FixJ